MTIEAMTATLHYIHDPMCGWCYGAAPLIQAARLIVEVKAHAGGMFVGETRQPISSAFREFILPLDRSIAERTGQPFGRAYVDGLLCDGSAVLDSEPLIAAMLAAQRFGDGIELDMLARIQRAHFVEGQRVAETDVLIQLAVDVGLNSLLFEQAFCAVVVNETKLHIAETQRFMGRAGARSYPALLLEREGISTPVDIAPFHRRPVEWRTWLRETMA